MQSKDLLIELGLLWRLLWVAKTIHPWLFASFCLFWAVVAVVELGAFSVQILQLELVLVPQQFQ